MMEHENKLTKKLLSRPKGFTWAELKKLLASFEYKETSAGKTSGSRVRFIHDNEAPISLHKPHPRSVLKPYQVKQICDALKDRGHIS